MNNVNSFLINWSIRFLENKDTIRKEIVSVEKSNDGFDFAVHYKDKVKYFVIMPVLENGIFSKIKDDIYISFITLNNMPNVKFVVNEWENLTKFKFLNIYFVNPFSSSDKVWIICPYVHDKICSKASLELGLKSMAEMVEAIDAEGLSNKIKLLREESGL